MKKQTMVFGIWFYALGTTFTGILNIFWRDFDASHQPFSSLGKNIPGQHILGSVVGVVLVAAGLAVLAGRSRKAGAAVSAIVYSFFGTLWLLRCFVAIHALGWRFAIVAGTSFGLAQQLMLVAGALILYTLSATPDARLEKRTVIAARWIFGLAPIVFGLLHLMGLRVFANIVPSWMHFGIFWAAATGIAFILAGLAICTRIKDVLAIRLLALMLLLFEFLVEIPPVLIRVHNQATWGAAVYNITAIGACWIFGEFLASRAKHGNIELHEDFGISPNRVVA